MTATIVLVLRIGLAAVLYYFLWRVLQTLWQELKQQSTSISSKKIPGIHFDITMGDGSESAFRFRQGEILVGRSTQCDISLADESLSANHARMAHHHGQWWLEDTGSTNGTFLNNDRVTVPTVIISGDEIKCGNTRFNVHIE